MTTFFDRMTNRPPDLPPVCETGFDAFYADRDRDLDRFAGHVLRLLVGDGDPLDEIMTGQLIGDSLYGHDVEGEALALRADFGTVLLHDPLLCGGVRARAR